MPITSMRTIGSPGRSPISPPRYVTTDLGRAAVKLDSYISQNRADVYAAISAALKVVRQNPRHS